MPQSQKGKYSARLSSTKKETFRENEDFFRMMVESLSGYSMFTTDKKGNISSWNTGSEELFGYSEKEIIGKNVSLIFTSEDIHKSIPKKEIEEAKEKGKFIEERNHVRKDGSVFWASGLVYPLKDKGKIHRGFTFILIDRTQEKAVDKRKDDFISTATHELKTPITSMRLFAEIVEKETEKRGDKIALESVRELNVQLDRLTALMNYLLDVAKVQQGRLELNKKFFDVNQLIEGVILMVKIVSKERTINFTKDKNKKEVYADRERLGQVLTNLLSNSVKYSTKEKEIIIKSAHIKSNIVISVQDFGEGIPESEQKLIFNRFYRANSAIDHHISGIGLGLYVAMQIIKAHHGKMWVKSAKGKGSTFYLSIPMKKKT
jgi:PAS domain S-box-containing protein